MDKIIIGDRGNNTSYSAIVFSKIHGLASFSISTNRNEFWVRLNKFPNHSNLQDMVITMDSPEGIELTNLLTSELPTYTDDELDKIEAMLYRTYLNKISIKDFLQMIVEIKHQAWQEGERRKSREIYAFFQNLNV